MFQFDIKQHLKYVEIHDLHEKICAFRELPFSRLNKTEIAKHISNVLCFDTPNGNVAILTPRVGSYPRGTRFYRVRRLEQTDTKFPLSGMRSESDAWNPPPHVVRKGRLNREGESLLYTTPINPKVAVEEMQIPDGDNFSLIVYEAMEEIRATTIGARCNDENLTSNEQLKLNMLNDFLAHEFTRDVGSGTEYLYDISETIAKDYFDLPRDIQDAWCYPSVADRPMFNVCLRPEVARQKLSLVGVQIASRTHIDENSGYFHVKCVASGFDDCGAFVYHRIGSETQKKLFPEIRSQ
ncbi:hypothetical protein [Chromohalobacter sp. 296-RDG]|uniref:hypothetical protein n=1 Tax=Chromohalobacter sp. 296-RDG TaxID=2994062 RepID=UPI0024698EE6|nr:hypothetical protein [Chromohalobacter sp. 296-RDG]